MFTTDTDQTYTHTHTHTIHLHYLWQALYKDTRFTNTHPPTHTSMHSANPAVSATHIHTDNIHTPRQSCFHGHGSFFYSSRLIFLLIQPLFFFLSLFRMCLLVHLGTPCVFRALNNSVFTSSRLHHVPSSWAPCRAMLPGLRLNSNMTNRLA